MSAKKWVRSSLQHLSEKLKDQGYAACPKTVGRLLKDLKYSLKVNVKRRAGSQHPDRNTQFEYIEAQKSLFFRMGWPIVSLDGKKKELTRTWRWCGCWQFQERRAILVLGS